MSATRIVRFAIALAACATATACSRIETAAPGARHAYTIPHTLRFSEAEDLVSLNPMLNSQFALSYLSEMTLAFLIRTDEHNDPTVPELATIVPTQRNGGISADGTTITWHLRHGVVWSDGAPFDADDVVFTTKLIQDPKTNIGSRDGWDDIVSMDEPDKYTVVYHLRKPYAGYASTFFSTDGANPAILPKHLLLGKDINTDPYNALPIGIGPFKYARWNRGESVELVANDRYFRGKPKLERVIYQEIPDRNVVLEEMRTHELDLWMEVSPHYIRDVRSIAGTHIDMVPSFTFDHLDFNNARPALRDPVVRRALRMAIDRTTLLQKIRFGVYDLSESVVPPVSRFHENLPLVPFDIPAANRMLDADGWVRGSDGIRSKNGVRLSLDFATGAGNPDTDQQNELIRGWWKQLGADVEIKHYLSSLFFALAQNGGIMLGGKFDVIVFAWSFSPEQDLWNAYSCDAFPPAGQNDLHYCDPAVDAAIDRAKVLYDPARRAPLVDAVQTGIDRDAPTVVFDARKQIALYNDDLKNFHPNAMGPFDRMMNVDI